MHYNNPTTNFIFSDSWKTSVLNEQVMLIACEFSTPLRFPRSESGSGKDKICLAGLLLLASHEAKAGREKIEFVWRVYYCLLLTKKKGLAFTSPSI